jgi:hypothetical protein
MRLLYSVMLRCIVRYMCTHFSEEPAVSIIKVKALIRIWQLHGVTLSRTRILTVPLEYKILRLHTKEGLCVVYVYMSSCSDHALYRSRQQKTSNPITSSHL